MRFLDVLVGCVRSPHYSSSSVNRIVHRGAFGGGHDVSLYYYLAIRAISLSCFDKKAKDKRN